tara:strand:- start:519 stop:848 length:330 start_codon:yes stop_codon:yes gene_type:complete
MKFTKEIEDKILTKIGEIGNLIGSDDAMWMYDEGEEYGGIYLFPRGKRVWGIQSRLEQDAKSAFLRDFDLTEEQWFEYSSMSPEEKDEVKRVAKIKFHKKQIEQLERGF